MSCVADVMRNNKWQQQQEQQHEDDTASLCSSVCYAMEHTERLLCGLHH
jgi:hypothetical protein